MAIRVVRLGTPRAAAEGIRLGTVRRPPRGVRKNRYARDDWFDVWLPLLAPSAALLSTLAPGSSARAWRVFTRRYAAEMKQPASSQLLQLLAALSHHADFSVGCYCENARRCHRTVLKGLLKARGAKLAG